MAAKAILTQNLEFFELLKYNSIAQKKHRKTSFLKLVRNKDECLPIAQHNTCIILQVDEYSEKWTSRLRLSEQITSWSMQDPDFSDCISQEEEILCRAVLN